MRAPAMKPKIRRRISRAAALTATAALAATVGALPVIAAAAPRPASAARKSAAAKLAQPAVPVLDWKRCDDGFYCATARVPLNYSHPRGAHISIAVISSRATGPGPSLGWLFINGGGPHAGLLLDHDSTADTARDMNLLREAVGDPALNYYGQSYGTLLGAIYANLYPASTGRIILDGNVNPVAWSTGTSQLPALVRLDSPQASQATMTAFLDLCGKATTKACAFSAGTPAATTARWTKLLHLARKHPIRLGVRTYTYADTITSVDLGSVAQWQSDAALLQQLWTAAAGGKPRPPVPGPAPAPPPADPGYYSGVEQQLAIMCADSPNPRHPAAYAAAAALGTFAPRYAWTTLGCADWPAAAARDRYTGPWNRRTATTILLLANTGDPVTAYQDSVAMSHDLARARLLTVDGYGHTTGANPSTCAIDYAVTYTLTGALPAPGTVCQQNATPFP